MASMALISLSLSLIGFWIIYLVIQYKVHQMKKIKNEIIKVANTALEVVDHEMVNPVRDNPKTAVLISSAAGLIAGNKFL